MRQQGFLEYFISAAGILTCAVLGMTMVSSAWAKDKLPEVSSDGLHLVKHAKVEVAYAKPGTPLGKIAE